MSRISQLVKKKRRKKKYIRSKVPALQRCPQKKGICIKVFTMTPRKPNSALRKVVRVRVSTGKFVTVYIPGEGHFLAKFNSILLKGGNIKDLPGVKYKAIRGKYDLLAVVSRISSRSKYGVKLKRKV